MGTFVQKLKREFLNLKKDVLSLIEHYRKFLCVCASNFAQDFAIVLLVDSRVEYFYFASCLLLMQCVLALHKKRHFPQISRYKQCLRMRYFTGIVGCLNKKEWDISKMPFARRKGSVGRPCRVSAFNRFLACPLWVKTLDVLDFRLASKNQLKILPLKALRKQTQK